MFVSLNCSEERAILVLRDGGGVAAGRTVGRRPARCRTDEVAAELHSSASSMRRGPSSHDDCVFSQVECRSTASASTDVRRAGRRLAATTAERRQVCAEDCGVSDVGPVAFVSTSSSSPRSSSGSRSAYVADCRRGFNLVRVATVLSSASGSGPSFAAQRRVAERREAGRRARRRWRRARRRWRRWARRRRRRGRRRQIVKT